MKKVINTAPTKDKIGFTLFKVHAARMRQINCVLLDHLRLQGLEFLIYSLEAELVAERERPELTVKVPSALHNGSSWGIDSGSQLLKGSHWIHSESQ